MMGFSADGEGLADHGEGLGFYPGWSGAVEDYRVQKPGMVGASDL